MTYTVKRIDEDIDFGCEERPDDVERMAVVTLIDANGNESVIKISDDLLYQKDINEGDSVYFNSDNTLSKALGKDWTEKKSDKPINMTSFTNTLQAIKSGKDVDWRCPFCGETVILMEKDDSHTLIGCSSCDMRINLDTN